MSYLTSDEIATYCGLSTGVTMDHVESASVLIDAYKGCSFGSTTHTEHVTLNYKRSSGDTRGKLKHFPRIAVTAVTAKTRSPFGSETIDCGVDSLEFDDDESFYFSFVMPGSLMVREVPKAVAVTYTSGYAVIPEAVKRATGILACNIKQMGGIMRWKSRDDYDIKVTLGNDGVFTEEVKAILGTVMVQ